MLKLSCMIRPRAVMGTTPRAQTGKLISWQASTSRAAPSITTPDYHNSHMGPQVRFSYRPQNTGGQYQTAAFHDFAASEAGTAMDWHFYTGNDWDWRTEIHWAGGDDSVDIAHAVEDL